MITFTVTIPWWLVWILLIMGTISLSLTLISLYLTFKSQRLQRRSFPWMGP